VHLGDVDRNTLLDYCQPTNALPQPLVVLPPRLDGVEPWTSRQLLAATQGPRAEGDETAPRFRRVPHKVRRGETLASLAERFEVSQGQLRRWNELPKGRPLKPGRELVIFVPLPAVAPRTPVAPAEATEPVVVAVAPRAVRTAEPSEDAAARREQAAANAREVARLQEVARQEKAQEARLVAIRQRQAIQKAAAEAQARMAARRAAQAQAAEAKLAEAKNTPEPEAEVALVTTEESEGPYTVRKGENLTKLAREHGVSAAQVVAWNELESETLVAGQKLVFKAPAEAEEAPRKQTKTASATKKAVAATTPRSVPGKPVMTPQVHLVQRGDTLFNISRRFGVTVQVLRELNNLTSDEVKLGQKLLVPQS
jgi:membrane-bound lytic murein transglycosylase D